MKSTSMMVIGASCALALSAYADDAMKSKSGAEIVIAKDIKWADAPPDLPKGAQIAVLHGDPSKAAEFTVRFKFPDGYKIAPHYHSKDENLTVVSGTLILHMGDTMTAEAHNLDAGAFHFLPGKMHHAAETKGETVLQLHGTGPFDIHYLNAADNPNPKASKK